MAERLSLRLGSSRLLAATLLGAHAMAAAALWLSTVPAVFALACSLALSVHLARVVRRDALRTDPLALTELDVLENGAVSVCTRSGLQRAYRVGRSSFVSPLLVVLSLRPEAGRWRRQVLIAADSVDADNFRRLRVWLRWRWRDGTQNAGPAQPRPASRR